jgi:hypothetical protein
MDKITRADQVAAVVYHYDRLQKLAFRLSDDELLEAIRKAQQAEDVRAYMIFMHELERRIEAL